MEEDIKILKNIIEQDFSNPMGWSGYYDSELKELQQAIRNLINKNKELEKMVELMAFSLADYVMYYEYDKCRNPEMIKAKANEEINYFKKKASEKE